MHKQRHPAAAEHHIAALGREVVCDSDSDRGVE